MGPFEYTALPARVVFGFGTLTRAAEELRSLGCDRAFVLSDAHHASGAAASLKDVLGNRCVDLSTDAAMHTPVDVTERVATRVADSDAGDPCGDPATCGCIQCLRCSRRARSCRSALGAIEAAGALFDLAARNGAPTSLRQIGLAESNLDEAADAASSRRTGTPVPSNARRSETFSTTPITAAGRPEQEHKGQS